MQEIWKNRKDLFLDEEIWKDIEGHSGDYQVSNYGRIKSFKINKINGKILKQIKMNGYLFVNLSKNGKGKPRKIHHLMFENFNNYKLKENECIHHKNENKLDNVFNNFMLMTNSDHKSLHMSGKNNPMYRKIGENNPNYGKKRPEHSKRMSGENNPQVILTEQDVIKIRELDLPQKELAEIFGVRQPTISNIKAGRTWKHII